jgi:hypothetical protein
MTTAFARRPTPSSAAAKKPKPRPEQKPSRGAADAEQVPVLIRLPDLTESAAKVETPIRRLAADSTAADLPPKLHVPEAIETQESPHEVGDSSDRTVQTLPFQKPPQERPREHRPPFWADVRIPRAATHAVIALSLIGVFVFAYLAIVGAGAKPEPATLPTAVDIGPGVQPEAHLDVATSTPPALPAEAVDVARTSGDTIAPPAAAPATARPPATPALEPSSPPEAVAQETPTEPADPPVSEEPATPPQPLIDAPANSTNVTETSPPPTAPPQDAGQAAAPPLTPDPAAPTVRPTAAPPTNSTTDLPLIPDSVSPEANVESPMLPPYPVTNPATYQYPVDYHLRLERLARGPQAEWEPSAPGGPYEQAGPVSTARLHPPIEPPPYR